MTPRPWARPPDIVAVVVAASDAAVDEGTSAMVMSKANEAMDEAMIVNVSLLPPLDPEDRARLIDVQKIYGGRPTNKVKLSGFRKIRDGGRELGWSPWPRLRADGASATQTLIL